MNRADFLKGALASAGALGAGWAALRPEDGPPRPVPSALSGDGRPTLDVGSAQIDPQAAEVRVEVRLSQPARHTVLVRVGARNGSDPFILNSALAGINYQPTEAFLVFRPGDEPVQVVTIPLTGRGRRGQWFELAVIDEIQGAQATNMVGRITFEPGAQTPAKSFAHRAPATPRKGALTYELDIPNFRANDTGRNAWRTRFSHGRTQPANKEAGYYADPILNPGTRGWQVRDGQLILRAEPLPKPLEVWKERTTYHYAASVVTGETVTSQLYGYYEWDAKVSGARGTWSALWLLPSDLTWPPEIDVLETPRNGRYGPGDLHVATHWGSPSGRHVAGVRVELPRLLGRPIDLVTDFHRHAVDWRPDYTTWFIDDQEVWQAPTEFHKSAFPIMNVAVGGWGGAPDLSSGTTELAIRNFRIWA